jgi:photosystem II stability/assembly factor-like uncharacterized protein
VKKYKPKKGIANPTWKIADGEVHADEEVEILGHGGGLTLVRWADGTRSWERSSGVKEKTA